MAENQFSRIVSRVNSQPVLVRLAAYFFGVVLLACLISPPLYWAGSALAGRGILPFLEGFPFHRYFSRSLQICALAMLWPAFRWVGIRRLDALGLERNPLRWRDLATGIAVALIPVILLGIGYLAMDIYRFKKELAFSGLLRVFAAASAVAVLEEFLFRGVLLGLCLRVMSPLRAAFLSSAVFAVVHFMRVAKPAEAVDVGWLSGFAQLPQVFSSAPPWPILGWGILSLVLAGLILAAATLRTRSLFLAVGIHAGWILGQQGLQWAAKFRIKPPDSLFPWVGPNVVSGAVPTGLVPVAALLLTAGAVHLYLRHARRSRLGS